MNKVLKIVMPSIIYIFFAYVFVWQISHLNSGIVYTELQDADKISFKYKGAIIILLYGLLLYLNIIFNQKRVVVINSIITASILYMHPGIFSFIASMLLVLFALIVAFLELKTKPNT